MALNTSSPVAYDCQTCGQPVYVHTGLNEWRHINRTAKCGQLAVVSVELFVTQLAVDVAA